jgi:hypothetical protein
VLAYAYGEDRQIVFEVRAPAHPAPRVRIPSFRDRPGETRDELKTRLRAFSSEVKRTERALDAAPSGVTVSDRMPKNEGEHIRQYVSWFYRIHTKGATKTALAKERHDQRHPADCKCDPRDDRSAIRAGIRKAEELLALDGLPIEESNPADT